uniref:CHD subfamily II SANT-like domain-containing protein n=1 Tax=Trichobilharzia regenti TaxID=157069 RepID=A0AA85K5L1_TRIRE|nr:unnamed protein product [Trichobilharzia regenti]
MELMFGEVDESHNVFLERSSPVTEVNNCVSQTKNNEIKVPDNNDNETSGGSNSVLPHKESGIQPSTYHGKNLLSNEARPSETYSYDSEQQHSNLRPWKPVDQRFTALKYACDKLLGDNCALYECGPRWHVDVDEASKSNGPVRTTPSLNRSGNFGVDLLKPQCWQPTAETYNKWRARVRALGNYAKWHQGELFIHNFGPSDRQLFNDAVMKFGLPPPGIIPPRNWLPSALHHKSHLHLFGYVDLYMKHLCDDRYALDDSKDTWSDGLPKEHLCVPAVLSRVAMLVLIRNKVLEYEDINGARSIATDDEYSEFKFNIDEGGLSLLRSMWNDECAQINNIRETICSQSQMAGDSEMILKSQRIWHSRHDYWLLAGILVHGYANWDDILADPRFVIVKFGVSGVLDAMNRLMNSELTTVPVRIPSDYTEFHAFLTDRLKLIEQALVIEQSLYEVAEVAVTRSTDQTSLDSGRIKDAAVNLSNKLILSDTNKCIVLPKDSKAKEATRAAVRNLQDLLEDMYADLPGMPASLIIIDGCNSDSKAKNAPNLSNESRNGMIADTSSHLSNNIQTDAYNNGDHSVTSDNELISGELTRSCNERGVVDCPKLLSETFHHSCEADKLQSTSLSDEPIVIVLSDDEDSVQQNSIESQATDRFNPENDTTNKNNAGEVCVFSNLPKTVSGGGNSLYFTS